MCLFCLTRFRRKARVPYGSAGGQRASLPDSDRPVQFAPILRFMATICAARQAFPALAGLRQLYGAHGLKD